MGREQSLKIQVVEVPGWTGRLALVDLPWVFVAPQETPAATRSLALGAVFVVAPVKTSAKAD